MKLVATALLLNYIYYIFQLFSSHNFTVINLGKQKFKTLYLLSFSLSLSESYNKFCWIYFFLLFKFYFEKTLQSHIQRFYIRFSLSFKTGLESLANTYGNSWNSLQFEQPTGNHESHIFCQYCEAKISGWKWTWACT